MSKLINPFHQYYELETNSTQALKYVLLKSAGIQKIIERYQAKYAKQNIDITITEYPVMNSKDFLTKLSNHIKELPDNTVKGVLFNATSIGNKFAHSSPYIIAKFSGKVTIVDFEDKISLLSLGFTVEQVDEYKYLQKDMISCGVFAINTVKNCLINAEFIAALKQHETVNFLSADNPTILDIKKIIGQGREFINTFSKEQKEKYVWKLPFLLDDNGNPKDINLKAFYKGHCYARLINPDHLNFLDENTREMVLKIDAKRQEIKDRKSDEASFDNGETELSEGVIFDDEEVSFEGDEIELPDESKTPLSSKNLESASSGNPDFKVHDSQQLTQSTLQNRFTK